MQVLSIVSLTAILSQVKSKFHCVGTCYSGRMFPLPKDIVHGKHLKGYSYKNITTDDPKKCYSSCVNDCRCKACQMKDSRCELMDEDHTSKPKEFVAESGYVYFDLKQESYKGDSHMVPPGVCHNGCCRFQSCKNGGTCIELCDVPKEKFYCNCPQPFTGKFCEKRVLSCLDYLRTATAGTTPPSGQYHIHFWNKPRPVICDFVGSNQAWTLIESFSRNNNAFKRKAFHEDYAIQHLTPNWKNHRQGLYIMQYMRNKSTMFRATCDFPKRAGVLTPDYLFGYLTDYDIINRGDVSDVCIKFAHVNVRGKDFFKITLPVWHVANSFHLHISSPTKNNCTGFPEMINSVVGEDLFGFYHIYNESSKCTATAQSTTQWWLGEEL